MNLTELKERKLIQWSLTYGAFAFGAIASMPDALGVWGVSDLAIRRLQVLIAAGFLPAVILAWFHGAEGRQRTTRREAVTLGAAFLFVLVVPFGIVRAPAADFDVLNPFTETDGRIELAVLPWDVPAESAEGLPFVREVEMDTRGALASVGALLLKTRAAVATFSSGTTASAEVEEALPRIAWILRGFGSKGPENVVIRVELEDVKKGELTWAGRFEGRFSPQALQTLRAQIVDSVANAVRASVTVEERSRLQRVATEDSTAWALYREVNSRQQAMQTDRTVNEWARSLLDAALARDPDFGEAKALKAAALTTLYQTLGGPRQHAEDGLRLSDEAVADDPDSYDVWWLRAYQFWVLGHVEAQREAALQALRLRPSGLGALRVLAEAEFARGRFPEFLGWTRQVIRVSPQQETAALFTGVVFLILDEHDRAAYWFARARENAPPGALGVTLTPFARLDMARGALDAAEARVDSAAVLRPEHGAVRRLRGEIKLLRGEWEAAIAAFPDGLRRGPEGAGLSTEVLRGIAYSELGQAEEAERLFSEAEQVLVEIAEGGGDRWTLHQEHAVIDALRGHVDSAIDWLEQAADAGMLRPQPNAERLLQVLQGEPRYDTLMDTLRQRREAQLRRIDEEGLEPPRTEGQLGPQVIN